MLWDHLAKLLAHPPVAHRLIKNAQAKPYYHLDGYMERWWLTPSWLLTFDEDGYLVPYDWVPMYLRVRVHHTLREDEGRNPHDHPADNRSVVLRGWFEEVSLFGHYSMVAQGETVFRRAEVFHRISAVPEGGVWTLFFLGRKRNKWGFLVGNRKVYHKYYQPKESQNVNN